MIKTEPTDTPTNTPTDDLCANIECGNPQTGEPTKICIDGKHILTVYFCKLHELIYVKRPELLLADIREHRIRGVDYRDLERMT